MSNVETYNDTFVASIIEYAKQQDEHAEFIFDYQEQHYHCSFDTQSELWTADKKVLVFGIKNQNSMEWNGRYALIYDQQSHALYEVFYDDSLAGYIEDLIPTPEKRAAFLNPYYVDRSNLFFAGRLHKEYSNLRYYPSRTWSLLEDYEREDEFDTDYCEGRYYCSQVVRFRTTENKEIIVTYNKYGSEFEKIQYIEEDDIKPDGHCCAHMNVEIVSIPIPDFDKLTYHQRKLFKDNVELSWGTASMRICTYCDTIHDK